MQVRVECWKPSTSRRNDGKIKWADHEGTLYCVSMKEACETAASAKHADHGHALKLVSLGD